MATLKSFSENLILKRILVVAGILAIVLILLHIWYVQNARSVLKQYITEQSNGKIRLELSQLNISLLTRRLQIHEADLVSTDSIVEPITYHVTFSRLSLNVGSIWTLLFHKKLLLDSIKLHDPVIQVMQWREDTAHTVVKDELSIPQEMGKIYNSLLTALDEFGVRRILVDNAKISLINKMKPGAVPVTVSSIFFDLARTPVRVGGKNVYLQKNHSLELRSSNQHITLPGRRHIISFKSFRLQLFRERVDLDSCTVTALPTDSIQSNYRIFFKKLSLTGVDFNAMSSQNVIKADTVYCEDPFFEINLYRSDAVKKKTEIPDPNKIIRELTGNFNMAFVGVKNAGIHFNISGKTKQAFLNTNKDNFEMQGFRINPDSTIPVAIRRFDMTLRDYFLYNEDSSSVYSFDSLRLLNSRIILNNFAVSSNSGRNKLRNEIDVRVPHFELSQLDWYELIFEQNIVASEAVLNDPVISFTRRKPGRTGKKLDLFASLVSLDSLVALENVSVSNGEVNMRLGPSTYFNVQGIDFNVYSNKLLRSKNKEGVRSAVEHLSFSRGVLRIKDITAELLNARYTGNNLVYADKVAISGIDNKIAATVNNVYIDNLQLDDNAETIDVDGLGWKSATVRLQVLPLGKKGNNGNIHLRNISGSNTRFNFSNGPLEISSFIQTLEASSLIKKGNGQIRAEGFMITGNDLQLKSKAAEINAASYAVGDETSRLTGVQVEQITGHDTLNIRSANVHITTKLNNLFANNLHMTRVNATNPVIVLNKWDTTKTIRDTAIAFSPVRIDELTAIAPDISITAHRNDSSSGIRIPWAQNGLVQASGILISEEGLRIGSVRANTTTAEYVKKTGEILGIQKGKIDMELSSILVSRKDDRIRWSGFINKLNLENANGFHLGRSNNNLRFHYASLGDLNLSSDYLPDFTQVMKANISAWLRIPQGHFIDSNSTVEWYNARYDNTTKSLSLDSFVYHPTRPLDSVLAHAPYQLDYITVKTGAVNINGLDITRYEKDSSFIANTISINNPVLTVYRDKKPPLSPFKKEKPLPVNMIKNISIPVSVQTVKLDNGIITYAEKNGESRKTGTLLLDNVSATLENIRNRNLEQADSLSLTFKATLMEAADINLHLKESYTDSLGGFLLTADISSADMAVLNPVLVPLLNIKIASGTLDSLSLRVVGREDLAYGEMDMHYRKFRIRMIDNGEPDESSLVQNILSYIANAFIIKSNNVKRTGVMFHKRTKGQSFVNYIMKTTVSGITSSIGVKTNRKYIKQYKQELKKSKNPAIRL